VKRTKTDPTVVAYEALRQLLVKSKEPTRRVLVEFYESDWERISKVKEELDLSWKDFFHAISMMLTVFEKDAEAHQVVANLMKEHW
jgi:hypothetical protein